MADFADAIDAVLAHEGGYVDHPADPGGATNWGISARFLAGIGDSRHPRDLSRADAIELYRDHFWDRYRYEDLPDGIATKVFDISVNAGPGVAHKVLQRALRACGAPVKADGALGPITLRATREQFPPQLIAAMRSEQAGFYRALVARKPRLGVFLKGWLRRAYEDGLFPTG